MKNKNVLPFRRDKLSGLKKQLNNTLMKTIVKVLIIMNLLFTPLLPQSIYSQIDDIKKKSDENAGDKSSNKGDRETTANNEETIGESCTNQAFSACFNFGLMIISDVIVQYTSNVYKRKPENPAILSLDFDAGFAPAYEYNNSTFYKYMVFLPAIRANIASFMIEFRGNLLTEFDDNLQNTFKCWDAVIGFNIVPSSNCIITLGTGIQREKYNDMHFHEYYLGTRIWVVDYRNFMELNYRLSKDYETDVVPFQEVSIKYNFRILNSEKADIHLTIGGHYQNYYELHDIWGLKTGIVLNIH